MKRFLYSIAPIVMCLIISCNSSSHKDFKSTADVTLYNDKPEEQSADKSTAKPAPPPPAAKDGAATFGTVDNMASNTADTATATPAAPDPSVLQDGRQNGEDWDKKIIKNARVTLELKDYKSFNVAMHDKLKKYGAYIAGEQQTESDARIENALTIKVPVAQFEDLMNSINGDGIKVLEKNISTEDVTAEMVDTKARIEAKKEVRDRYMELLKGAKTMKDILAVQEEINVIQEDLEAASGRVNYLSHSAAYSTISLTYYQYLNGSTADTAAPTFFTKLHEAFATGGAVIINLLLFCISIWPLLIAGIFLLFYVKRWKVKKA